MRWRAATFSVALLWLLSGDLSAQPSGRPTIQLLYPDNRAEVETAVIRVTGRVDARDREIAKVTLVVNGKEVLRRTGLSRHKSVAIDTEVPLVEGVNAIVVRVTESNGTAHEEARAVLRKPRLVTLELRGLPGARARVGDQPGTLDGRGVLLLRLPPGEYPVEVTATGFRRVRESISLGAGQSVVVYRLPMAKAVPPTIVLLDPKPGSTVHTDRAVLKVEVRGGERVATLKISRGSAERVYSPDAKAVAGELWLVEAPVELVIGVNEIRLEATDVEGLRSAETVRLNRDELVALELRGSAGTKVRVNQEWQALDSNGALAFRLPPGKYQIEATREGHDPLRETITLQPGQASVARRLELQVARPVEPPAPAGRTSTARPAEPKPSAPPPRRGESEAPKIVITFPPNDLKVEQDQIGVVGLVTSSVGVASIQVTVNGTPAPATRDLSVWGSARAVPINTPVALQFGLNVIAVAATDRAGNSSVETRTVTRVGSQLPTPVAKRSERHAVVIGVGAFENEAIPALKYPERDARAMYEFLTSKGRFKKENVELLTDSTREKPTLRNIRRALGERLVRRAGRDDTVLILYAGHGAPEVDPAGQENDGLAKYLVPRDADPDSLYSTGFAMDEINNVFRRLQAERIVVMLDTCFSGAGGGRTFMGQRWRGSGVSDMFLDRLTRSKGRVIITASGVNEVCLELPEPIGHGIFTHYLLEGMGGKADLNGDGVVTVSELYKYVEERVEKHAREVGGKQRPMYKGEVEGDIPLIEIRNR